MLRDGSPRSETRTVAGTVATWTLRPKHVGSKKSVNMCVVQSLLISRELVADMDSIGDGAEQEADREWTLLFRGSRDGLTKDAFHRLCDGKVRITKNRMELGPVHNPNVLPTIKTGANCRRRAR